VEDRGIGVRFPARAEEFYLLHSIKPVSRTHPTFCPVGSGLIKDRYVQRLGINGDVPQLPLNVFIKLCLRKHKELPLSYKHYATSRKVAESIPDEVTGVFI
jgi:hypothetical protein